MRILSIGEKEMKHVNIEVYKVENKYMLLKLLGYTQNAKDYFNDNVKRSGLVLEGGGYKVKLRDYFCFSFNDLVFTPDMSPVIFAKLTLPDPEKFIRYQIDKFFYVPNIHLSYKEQEQTVINILNDLEEKIELYTEEKNQLIKIY